LGQNRSKYSPNNFCQNYEKYLCQLKKTKVNNLVTLNVMNAISAFFKAYFPHKYVFVPKIQYNAYFGTRRAVCN
jgi:hypothetical protein